MDNTTPQPSPTPASAPERRPMFDTVVVSTPVILTVIATFILGRSSSEMTQAQYQRAVASQKQSKVADEWAFFQAKRIRGTTYEATSVGLFAQKAGPFTPESLLDTAQDFLREIALTEKDAPKLTAALKALDNKTASDLAQVKASLFPSEPDPKAEGKKPVLTPSSVKDAFAALDSYKPKAEKAEVDDDEQSKILSEILDDVRAFKPESEIGEKTLRLGLKTETIDAAIEKAKAHAKKVNERGKYIDRVLEEFDALVDRQVSRAREYQRIVGPYLRDLDNAEEVQKIERRLDRVRDLSARLLMDYKAARFAFDARRYEDDARSNQQAAFLYDVHVYQSSAKSDKHLKRSLGFMIAMLVAQVGVTVGSIALGFKRRIPAWALAAIAGISAIIFGVLVFLELAPML